MLDKTSTHRLIGAGIMLVAAAAVLPVILDGERPPELDVQIAVPPPPTIPTVKIQPVQPLVVPTVSDSDNKISESAQAKVNEPSKAKPEEKTPVLVASEPEKMDHALPARWTVQIATFKSRDNAERLIKKLQDANYPAYTITTKSLYKVYIGPQIKREKAESIREEVKKEFLLNGLVVKYSTN